MSGSAGVPNAHLLAVNDHRDGAFSLGKFQHASHGCCICQNVEVFKRDLLPAIVLTGLESIGSRIFAKNEHFFVHVASCSWIS